MSELAKETLKSNVLFESDSGQATIVKSVGDVAVCCFMNIFATPFESVVLVIVWSNPFWFLILRYNFKLESFLPFSSVANILMLAVSARLYEVLSVSNFNFTVCFVSGLVSDSLTIKVVFAEEFLYPFLETVASM